MLPSTSPLRCCTASARSGPLPSLPSPSWCSAVAVCCVYAVARRAVVGPARGLFGCVPAGGSAACSERAGLLVSEQPAVHHRAAGAHTVMCRGPHTVYTIAADSPLLVSCAEVDKPACVAHHSRRHKRHRHRSSATTGQLTALGPNSTAAWATRRVHRSNYKQLASAAAVSESGDRLTTSTRSVQHERCNATYTTLCHSIDLTAAGGDCMARATKAITHASNRATDTHPTIRPSHHPTSTQTVRWCCHSAVNRS